MIAQSIADQLRAVLAQAKADGATDDEVLALLQTVQADVTWDTGVLRGELQNLTVQVSMVQSELDQRITALQADVDAQLAAILAAIVGPPPPPPATQLVITLNQGGTPMPNGAISIDATGQTASFAWLDDHGDVTPDPPVSADGGPVTVVLACSNPAIATLAADPTTPQTFDITPLSVGGATESSPGSGQWAPDGTVTIGATAVDDQGAPAVFADGQPVTATPAPFGVFPGPAASLVVTA